MRAKSNRKLRKAFPGGSSGAIVTGVCARSGGVELEIGVLGVLGLVIGVGNKGVAWLACALTPDAPDAIFFTFQTVAPSLQKNPDSESSWNSNCLSLHMRPPDFHDNSAIMNVDCNPRVEEATLGL
jgi:hypothetical protein